MLRQRRPSQLRPYFPADTIGACEAPCGDCLMTPARLSGEPVVMAEPPTDNIGNRTLDMGNARLCLYGSASDVGIRRQRGRHRDLSSIIPQGPTGRRDVWQPHGD